MDLNAEVKREGNLDGDENSRRGEICAIGVPFCPFAMGGVKGGNAIGGRCGDRSGSWVGVGFKSDAIP